MARQTWTDLRSRLKIILRNRDDTDFPSRCERWLRQAYFELAAAYRFYELEKRVMKNMVIAESTISIADVLDLWYIYDIRSTSSHRRLTQTTTRKIDDKNLSQGVPSQYVRYGFDIEFDRIADIAYEMKIRYKAKPTEPVFAGSAASVLPEQWDDVILARAAKKAWPELYEQERAEYWRLEEIRLIAELPTVEVVDMEDAVPAMRPTES